jgi:hypothetical protein
MAAISPYYPIGLLFRIIQSVHSYNRIIPDNRSDWSGPLAPSVQLPCIGYRHGEEGWYTACTWQHDPLDKRQRL